MAQNETPLEMIERRIAEQEAKIALQRWLIGELRADGHPIDHAQALLKEMHNMLVEMQKHRDALRRNLDQN